MIKWAEQAHAGVVVASLLTGGVCRQVVKTSSTFSFFFPLFKVLYVLCGDSTHVIRSQKQNMMRSKVALFFMCTSECLSGSRSDVLLKVSFAK